MKSPWGAAATRTGILDGLGWLGARLAADGDATALIYYSGHGWCDEAQESPAYYLLPHDVRATADDLPQAASALP
ncbi:MAG: hypothetical protein HGA21_16245, partial [Burkholderiaceae bacterium]|nr:hypothetical protein [Burkholderiaceae bacterium]